MLRHPHSENDIMHVPSKYSVPETIRRLDGLATSKGLTVFAHIDCSGDTAKAGLRMRATQLLIFGNPKSGTSLMITAPSIAVDLPLKALAWGTRTGRYGFRTTHRNISWDDTDCERTC